MEILKMEHNHSMILQSTWQKSLLWHQISGSTHFRRWQNVGWKFANKSCIITPCYFTMIGARFLAKSAENKTPRKHCSTKHVWHCIPFQNPIVCLQSSSCVVCVCVCPSPSEFAFAYVQDFPQAVRIAHVPIKLPLFQPINHAMGI